MTTTIVSTDASSVTSRIAEAGRGSRRFASAALGDRRAERCDGRRRLSPSRLRDEERPAEMPGVFHSGRPTHAMNLDIRESSAPPFQQSHRARAQRRRAEGGRRPRRRRVPRHRLAGRQPSGLGQGGGAAGGARDDRPPRRCAEPDRRQPCIEPLEPHRRCHRLPAQGRRDSAGGRDRKRSRSRMSARRLFATRRRM